VLPCAQVTGGPSSAATRTAPPTIAAQASSPPSAARVRTRAREPGITWITLLARSGIAFALSRIVDRVAREGRRRPLGHQPRWPSAAQVHPFATHGHTLAAQQLTLAPAAGDRAVRTHHPVPGNSLVGGGQHAADQSWRNGIDVAVRLYQPFGNLANALQDAVDARVARAQRRIPVAWPTSMRWPSGSRM